MKKIVLSAALYLAVISLPAATCIQEGYVSCGNGNGYHFTSVQPLTLEQCDALAEYILDNLC